jgi:methylated-DNA-[protein]-cysteine S-methyltransferase
MAAAIGFCLFDTAVGACGIAWSADGVKGVHIPEADAEKTRARLKRRFPDAVETPPPPPVAEAIAGIQALVAGERRDLTGVGLDLSDVGDFPRRVYAIARAVGPGETITYGEIAKRLGDPTAARAVGEAMGRNPFGIVVPCHRVIGAGGKLTGFSANGGVATKLKLLEIEGAQIGAGAPLFGDLPLAVKPERPRRA